MPRPRALPCLALLPLAFAASAQTYTQTEEILYYDNTAHWTLGQVMPKKRGNRRKGARVNIRLKQ